MILEPLAAGLEDIREDARIEEEGRADVERVSAGRAHRAGASADHGFLLENRDRQPVPGEQQRGRQAAGARADDGNPLRGRLLRR